MSNIAKKAYSSPGLQLLGSVKSLTRGNNGSNVDHGHDSANIKLGNG
jgi:hypothetical protein